MRKVEDLKESNNPNKKKNGTIIIWTHSEEMQEWEWIVREGDSLEIVQISIILLCQLILHTQIMICPRKSGCKIPKDF